MFPIILCIGNLGSSSAGPSGAHSCSCSHQMTWRGWGGSRLALFTCLAIFVIYCLGHLGLLHMVLLPHSTDWNQSKGQHHIKELEKQTPFPDGRSNHTALLWVMGTTMLSSLEAQFNWPPFPWHSTPIFPFVPFTAYPASQLNTLLRICVTSKAGKWEAEGRSYGSNWRVICCCCCFKSKSLSLKKIQQISVDLHVEQTQPNVSKTLEKNKLWKVFHKVRHVGK